jgi:hypothetical protein
VSVSECVCECVGVLCVCVLFCIVGCIVLLLCVVCVKCVCVCARTDTTHREHAKKLDSTPHCSRVVPHPSTKRAQTVLTSVFG